MLNNVRNVTVVGGEKIDIQINMGSPHALRITYTDDSTADANVHASCAMSTSFAAAPCSSCGS